jgi:CRISPR-associated endonuclease/helicase Cas3
VIVTIISECHGRAIAATQKVLDAYAHRIGARTWQTVITQQGLDAVRSRLSKTARKNTAVACHRVRGHRRVELLWIVGNRRVFDAGGRVPVHRTARDLIREDDENDWRYLPLIQSMVGIAALMHDVGKAWQPFQTFLTDRKARDPVRHEWISLILFLAAIGNKKPSEWAVSFKRLPHDPELRRQVSERWIEDGRTIVTQTLPLTTDRFGIDQWIAWLILSHHRLPNRTPEKCSGSLKRDVDLFSEFCIADGYEKFGGEFHVETHWRFPNGLPVCSEPWCDQMRYWGERLHHVIESLGLDTNELPREIVRPTLTFAHAMLVTGDHEFSSRNKNGNWKGTYLPVANTVSPRDVVADPSLSVGSPKQFLDEHLIGVTEAAVATSKLLPAMESELPWIEQPRVLRKPSSGRFVWQNRAVETIRRWRRDQPIDRRGFFGINLASTGCGKTLANVKIVDTIEPDRLRLTLALGLRTLTLQTGRQLRDHLRLHDSELAVIVGSAAVRELDEQRHDDLQAIQQSNAGRDDGSESAESLTSHLYIDFVDAIPDARLSTVLTDTKSRQFLKAPILACTIDHLMPAVEATRGGRHTLPMLRLMSADLVIDEVDDFDALDMPAVSRLVHLTGMLGRRVLLSSATIPPAIAEGLFAAYQSGWQSFAKFRDRDAAVTAYWTDEFKADIARVADVAEFAIQHTKFVSARVRQLAKEERPRSRAKIVAIEDPNAEGNREDVASAKAQAWQDAIADQIQPLHEAHHWQDPITGKRVSIGIIRVANVDPCIDLSRHLLSRELSDNFAIRLNPYHARQVLLVRSEIERHLDRVLKRDSDALPSADATIASHLSKIDADDVAFIVVASPVAEIGRDHDYDWAIIEPSSMRSIIQMAGRVRRHRRGISAADEPNIGLLNFNRRAFVNGSEVAFKWPGFEGIDRLPGTSIRLATHRIDELIDTAALSQRLDASARMLDPTEPDPTRRLADLEHAVLRRILTDARVEPAFVHGWCEGDYYLCDVAQIASRFRSGAPQSDFRLYVDDDGQAVFRQHDPRTWYHAGELPAEAINLTIEPLADALRERLWFELDYSALIEQQMRRGLRGRASTCRKFGELRLEDDDHARKFRWNAALGAWRVV